MATNIKLNRALKNKNDEFYTQYQDIENEILEYYNYDKTLFNNKTVLLPCDDPELSNFTNFFINNFKILGLKKLISTCYSNKTNGKILEVSNTTNFTKSLKYLNGNGDFRNHEVSKIMNSSDIVVTNPPFSMFRQFISWLNSSNKNYIVICNKNCVTYKEIFPLIKSNKIWSGFRSWSGGMWFKTEDSTNWDKLIDGIKMKNVSSIWLTNLQHSKRNIKLKLYTMEQNLKNNINLVKKNAYKQYDNYKAIEIPEVKAIPCDFKGIMGVPISFLDKYNPNQFKIIGATESEGRGFSEGLWDKDSGITHPLLCGKKIYKRIFIQHINQ